MSISFDTDEVLRAYGLTGARIEETDDAQRLRVIAADGTAYALHVLDASGSDNRTAFLTEADIRAELELALAPFFAASGVLLNAPAQALDGRATVELPDAQRPGDRTASHFVQLRPWVDVRERETPGSGGPLPETAIHSLALDAALDWGHIEGILEAVPVSHLARVAPRAYQYLVNGTVRSLRAEDHRSAGQVESGAVDPLWVELAPRSRVLTWRGQGAARRTDGALVVLDLSRLALAANNAELARSRADHLRDTIGASRNDSIVASNVVGNQLDQSLASFISRETAERSAALLRNFTTFNGIPNVRPTANPVDGRELRLVQARPTFDTTRHDQLAALVELAGTYLVENARMLRHLEAVDTREAAGFLTSQGPERAASALQRARLRVMHGARDVVMVASAAAEGLVSNDHSLHDVLGDELYVAHAVLMGDVSAGELTEIDPDVAALLRASSGVDFEGTSGHSVLHIHEAVDILGVGRGVEGLANESSPVLARIPTAHTFDPEGALVELARVGERIDPIFRVTTLARHATPITDMVEDVIWRTAWASAVDSGDLWGQYGDQNRLNEQAAALVEALASASQSESLRIIGRALWPLDEARAQFLKATVLSGVMAGQVEARRDLAVSQSHTLEYAAALTDIEFAVGKSGLFPADFPHPGEGRGMLAAWAANGLPWPGSPERVVLQQLFDYLQNESGSPTFEDVLMRSDLHTALDLRSDEDRAALEAIITKVQYAFSRSLDGELRDGELEPSNLLPPHSGTFSSRERQLAAAVFEDGDSSLAIDLVAHVSEAGRPVDALIWAQRAMFEVGALEVGVIGLGLAMRVQAPREVIERMAAAITYLAPGLESVVQDMAVGHYENNPSDVAALLHRQLELFTRSGFGLRGVEEPAVLAGLIEMRDKAARFGLLGIEAHVTATIDVMHDEGDDLELDSAQRHVDALVEQTRSVDPLERARALFELGDFEDALATLSGTPSHLRSLVDELRDALAGPREELQARIQAVHESGIELPLVIARRFRQISQATPALESWFHEQVQLTVDELSDIPEALRGRAELLKVAQLRASGRRLEAMRVLAVDEQGLSLDPELQGEHAVLSAIVAAEVGEYDQAFTHMHIAQQYGAEVPRVHTYLVRLAATGDYLTLEAEAESADSDLIPSERLALAQALAAFGDAERAGELVEKMVASGQDRLEVTRAVAAAGDGHVAIDVLTSSMDAAGRASTRAEERLGLVLDVAEIHFAQRNAPELDEALRAAADLVDAARTDIESVKRLSDLQERVLRRAATRGFGRRDGGFDDGDAGAGGVRPFPLPPSDLPGGPSAGAVPADDAAIQAQTNFETGPSRGADGGPTARARSEAEYLTEALQRALPVGARAVLGAIEAQGELDEGVRAAMKALAGMQTRVSEESPSVLSVLDRRSQAFRSIVGQMSPEVLNGVADAAAEADVATALGMLDVADRVEETTGRAVVLPADAGALFPERTMAEPEDKASARVSAARSAIAGAGRRAADAQAARLGNELTDVAGAVREHLSGESATVVAQRLGEHNPVARLVAQSTAERDTAITVDVQPGDLAVTKATAEAKPLAVSRRVDDLMGRRPAVTAGERVERDVVAAEVALGLGELDAAKQRARGVAKRAELLGTDDFPSPEAEVVDRSLRQITKVAPVVTSAMQVSRHQRAVVSDAHASVPANSSTTGPSSAGSPSTPSSQQRVTVGALTGSAQANTGTRPAATPRSEASTPGSLTRAPLGKSSR